VVKGTKEEGKGGERWRGRMREREGEGMGERRGLWKGRIGGGAKEVEREG